MRRRLIGGIVVAALVALYAAWPGDHGAAAPPASAAAAPLRAPVAASPPASRPAGPAAARRPLPRSLADTEVTGGFAVDAAGNLVFDENVRRLFDYFLTAIGEDNLDDIRQRIEAEIAHRLTAPADDQARDLLRRYLAFRAAVARLDSNKVDLATRVAEIRAIRRAEMGAAADAALFASDDALTDLELVRRKVMAEGISDDERRRLVAEAEARLPESLRVVREAVMAPVVSMAHEEALRQSGASAADIQAYRTATFGPEAAQRLAVLDDQRAQWQGRLDSFRAERANLDATIADEATRNRELARLIEREFSPPERIRLAAVERIAEHPLPSDPPSD